MQKLSNNFRKFIPVPHYFTHNNLYRPTVGAIQLGVLFIKPLSYLGPYSFRSWIMDTFCPVLGEFGRSVTAFRRILKTMDETARAVYRDR